MSESLFLNRKLLFILIVLLVLGTLFLGKVWGKLRPMIEIKKEDVIYHAGISHTQKKGMVEIKQKDLEENSSFEVGENAFVGLCNKSKAKMKFGDLGASKKELDDKILVANPKLKEKVEKRKKA